MGKGVSVNVLVMLSVSIIIMLIAVAWFMGAFAPTAQESSLKQRFDSSCLTWTMNNCAEDPSTDKIPEKVCSTWNKLMHDTDSNDCTTDGHEAVALACGCTEPFGNERS